MRRHQNGSLRPGWEAQIQAEGLVYSVTRVGDTDVSYWREAQYYSLTNSEIELLAAAGNTLFQMFTEAGDHIIENNLFANWAYPRGRSRRSPRPGTTRTPRVDSPPA